jgi:uncharacterized protein (TIGR03083 family)
MAFEWNESQRAFGDAAAWFVDMTTRVGDRWDRPGLGEWTVRDLVGHTSRSLLTVATYLSRPADSVDIDSAAGYVVATREIAAGSEVAARGRPAGTALGEEPPAEVARIAARVLPLVESRTGDELVATIAGGMRLSDYLPTRTFELAVHTCDLAAALGEPMDVPLTAAGQALHLVASLAADDRRAGPLLLAATGRKALPEGFSVL